MRWESRQIRNWVITGLVICSLLGVNVATSLTFYLRSPWLAVVMLGICIGQLNLIATWAALAPGNIMVRLPWSLLLTTWMWQALVLGNRIMRYYPRGEAILLGLVLLFGLLVAMAPLAIAARFFRWRLLGWQQEDASSIPPTIKIQFHLRHLLLSMFLLSLSMATVRWILPEGEGWEVAMDDEELLYVILPAVAFCNVVVTIPCIWAHFASPKLLPLLAAGWVAYGALLTGAEFGFFWFFLGSPGINPVEQFFFIYLVNLMQCVTVFGVLLIFRSLGFQLVRSNSGGNATCPPGAKTLTSQPDAAGTSR